MSNAYVPTLRRMLSERPLVRGQVTMEYEALSAALAWHEAAEQLARAEATLAAIRAFVTPLKPVPPTIATDERFRDIYGQGWRHALCDVLALLDAAPKDTP